MDGATVFCVKFFSRSDVLEQRSMQRVCLSVCPTHAGNVPKLMTVGACNLHIRVAQGLVFQD